jgi:hypothetical protein
MRLRPRPDGRQMPDRRPLWRGERRAIASIRELAHCITAVYDEHPGLRLTPAQAADTWHVQVATCESVFELLVQHGALARMPEGHYVAARG